MAKIKVIGKAEITVWAQRWRTLSVNRFENDYKIAVLAQDIRSEFPAGPSGDMQFMRFVRSNLKGTNGVIMGRKAAAVGRFTEAQWKTLGGWGGISFLSALTGAERSKVLNALRGAGPHHYSTIRTCALKLGIVSRQKGRDTRSRAEERVQSLQRWLVNLYKTVKGLPPMPKDVEKALTAKTLADLASRLNAAKRASA